jgi:hypothetical protein
MSLFIRPVAIDVIRHDDKPCFLGEGHGGKPVEYWPVFRFFSLYLSGSREAGFDGFCEWYKEQYSRYWNTPKEYGGVRGGSMFRLIRSMHEKNGLSFDGDPVTASPEIFDEAVRERVRQRFELADAIRTHGYQTSAGSTAYGVRKNGAVMLIGGHHRAAILRALEHTSIPAVAVYPNHLCCDTIEGFRKGKWRKWLRRGIPRRVM